MLTRFKEKSPVAECWPNVVARKLTGVSKRGIGSLYLIFGVSPSQKESSSDDQKYLSVIYSNLSILALQQSSSSSEESGENNSLFSVYFCTCCRPPLPPAHPQLPLSSCLFHTSVLHRAARLVH